MQCSGLQIFAFLLLLAGTILIAASIGTNHWSWKSYSHNVTQIKDPLAQLSGTVTQKSEWRYERGLWKECTVNVVNDFKQHSNCTDGFSELVHSLQELQEGRNNLGSNVMREWKLAVLALISGSALLSILSLLFSPCCCNRCGLCLVLSILFAAMLCAAGLGTFVYYVETERKQEPIMNADYDWSFWCAVAGGGCQILSAIVFAISRCRQHSYSHTI